jgi:hypothetical protein
MSSASAGRLLTFERGQLLTIADNQVLAWWAISPRATAPLQGSAATLREGPNRRGPSRIEPMARRRIDTIRRTDRTYFISAARRAVGAAAAGTSQDRLRPRASQSSEQRSLLFAQCSKGAMWSANSANDALKHVQHAIAYLRKFERRPMKCVRRWVLSPSRARHGIYGPHHDRCTV